MTCVVAIGRPDRRHKPATTSAPGATTTSARVGPGPPTRVPVRRSSCSAATAWRPCRHPAAGRIGREAEPLPPLSAPRRSGTIQAGSGMGILASPLATIGSTMVPSHTAAAALLLSLSPKMWLQRHAAAVADVASFLAVARAPRGPPGGPRPGGNGGTAARPGQGACRRSTRCVPWVTAMRVPEWLRRARLRGARTGGRQPSRRAPVRRFLRRTGRPPRPSSSASGATPTSAHSERVVTLDQRFARWARRHPEEAELLCRRARASCRSWRPRCATSRRRVPSGMVAATALGHGSVAGGSTGQ